jgi:acetyl-CoA C-acetyltransferase
MASVQGSAASIIAGMDKVIIAGGAESLSSMPMVNKRILGTDDWAQWMSPSHPETPDAPAFDMSITVGYNTAKAVGLTREDCDAWAVRSHARAIAAIDEGRLQEEIVPIEVTLRDGTTKIFDTDEHPRRGSSMETLGALKTLHPEIENFPITAGNSSGVNDAGAAVMIVSSDYAKAHGLKPRARIRMSATAGTEPLIMLTAPGPAAQRCLDKAGMSKADIDLWEINEAFAAVVLKFMKDLDVSHDVVNVDGGAIALGHPIGATGGMLIGTAVDTLERLDKSTALVAMCTGGGMGTATILERM